MIINFHLIVTDTGSVSVRKNKPNLNWDEVSIAMRLELPAQLFTRPQFEAKLKIPETAIQAHNVPVDFTDNIQDAIQQATGYEVRVSLVQQEGGVE